MGKKNFKVKVHKVPSTKWIVLVNAWGFDGQFEQPKFNQICLWFEFLLRAEYPKFARVKTLFYQKTHHNFIVELPKEIEGIHRYLGGYHCQTFLTEDYARQRANDGVVLLYEYNYASFGNPASTNWSEAYPSYNSKDIPVNTPLKPVFDAPIPAPPPPVGCRYAQPNPPRVAGIIYGPPKHEPAPSVFFEPTLDVGKSAATSAIQSDLGAGRGSIQDRDRDSEPLEDDNAPIVSNKGKGKAISPRVISKLDLHEDDDPDAFLDGLGLNAPSMSPPRQYRDVSEPVEFPDVQDDEMEDYEPTAEMAAAAAELLALMGASEEPDDDEPEADQEQNEEPVYIKPEPIEENMTDYEPSGAEVTAPSSLQHNERSMTPNIRSGTDAVAQLQPKAERSDQAIVQIKPEPIDRYKSNHPTHSKIPESENMWRRYPHSATSLGSENETRGQGVKAEHQDVAIPPANRSHVRNHSQGFAPSTSRPVYDPRRRDDDRDRDGNPNLPPAWNRDNRGSSSQDRRPNHHFDRYNDRRRNPNANADRRRSRSRSPPRRPKLEDGHGYRRR